MKSYPTENAAERFGLSKRSKNICIAAELTDTNSVIEYLENNGDFLRLHNCGKKSSEELEAFCSWLVSGGYESAEEKVKYDKRSIAFRKVKEAANSIYSKEIKDSILEKLHIKYSHLPTSVKKIINADDSYSFSGILELYKYLEGIGFDYRKIHNVGKQNANDIDEFIDSFLNLLVSEAADFEQSASSTPYSMVSKLDEKRRTIITYYFEASLRAMSVRAQNAIKNLLGDDNEILTLYEKLEEIDFKFLEIQYVGINTEKELKELFDKLELKAESLYEKDDEEISWSFFEAKVLNLGAADLIVWLEMRKKAYFKRQFPILELIVECMDKEVFLPKRESLIILAVNDYDSRYSNLTLEELGKMFGVTRERVRQIGADDKLLEEFWVEIKRVVELVEKKYIEDERYYTLKNESFIVIHDDLETEEDHSFSHSFLIRLNTILDKEYKVLDLSDLRLNNINDTQSYAIHQRLLSILDWKQAIVSLDELLSGDIEKTLELNLSGFLSSFKMVLADSFSEDWLNIVATAESVLYSLFGLNTDINGNLIIRRTTYKSIYEYVEEILEETQVPMTVHEISRIFNERNNRRNSSPESIRSSITKELDSIFIYVGMSTYALKKWESEGRMIGGSIRDLVKMYLERYDEPKHIKEIADFVCQHRDTNKMNILTNIQQEDSGIFEVYGVQFIGLSNNKTKFEYNVLNGRDIIKLKKKFRKKDGSISCMKDELITFLVDIADVKPIQVESYLEDKIESGEFLLDNDKVIIE